MIPKECKRLAEVDFPIAEVSKHATREKSIRHGHPSTLHLWWARRPLASCRAMLMALLLPDPCDEHCPEDFKVAAKGILLGKPNRPTGWAAEVKTLEGLRKVLLKLIGDFANWDNSADKDYLETARALIKAAHPEETPLVVDPFAGGGSIPLEALRLGCETFASDLNPVACLILKVMLEDIPRHGPELAEELRRVGGGIKKQAEKELAEFYPKDPDGATPIAYLWARTIKCESPNCGAEIPLMRSFWLCKKVSRKRAIRHKIMRPASGPSHVEFEIFEPKADKEVHGGTVTRAKATCLCCGTVLPPERVRTQLSEQRGGADVIFDARGNRCAGARMLTVVTVHPGMQGRKYRIPFEGDYKSVWKAQKRLNGILDEWESNGRKDVCPVPDEPLPHRNTLGLRVPNYGVRTWGDMFSRRQKIALLSLSSSVRSMTTTRISDALRRALSLAVSRTADYCSANCSLHVGRDVVRNTWARNALPIVWDFYEINPFGEGSGNFGGALDWVLRVAEKGTLFKGNKGSVEQADAAESPLPDQSIDVWFTDPPYYNAIGYAESSDFFYVWLKRASSDNSFGRNPFEPGSLLSPKQREAIQDDTFEDVYGTKKDASFFEAKMSTVFSEGRRVTRGDGIASVVFAHKTTEGWESLLASILLAGWTVTGSWPIQTEMENKVSGSQAGEKKAMLLASVHLVCRPRPEDAMVGDWADVLRELPNRVGNWMERLQGEGIRGADLVFACIGPALEIFSRYSRVETADGREVNLAEYLEKVWEVVGRMALEQVLGTEDARARNGAAGALEEDARLTALFLWTLQATNGEKNHRKDAENAEEKDVENEEDDLNSASSVPQRLKGFSLVFDVARRFAQPLGIDLPKWENRIIKTEKGVVRLLPVSERAKQLFGQEGAKAAADWIEHDPVKSLQMKLFPELEKLSPPKIRGRGRGKIAIDPAAIDSDSMRQATTLDRVHAAMLLQAGGQTNALRSLIKAEQDRSPDFLRLANALSALYPKGSEEKRLLDAMLLAVPR
uniref:DUF1156 domain-containing protein n=1 Tax=Candidatus Desulfatibia profunda TaxID=2841695 RepID=A0A8J6TG66_9BACT|nr:DUF1156 domain-containing protein [Candidatus Desulfatibia profunda]